MEAKALRLVGWVLVLLVGLSWVAIADYVYVANPYLGDDDLGALVILRASDLRIVETLRIGNRAHSIAVSPDGDRIWVTCPGSAGSDGSIYVLGFTLTGSLEVRDIIDVGDTQPFGIAFTPNGRSVYVAFESVGQIGVFDATTHAYETVDVGDDPAFVAITPDGSKAYAIMLQNPRVVAIRTSDRRVVAEIGFESRDLQDAVVSPDGGRLYVASRQMRRIEVIDTVTDTALTPITAPFSLELVDSPRAIGISPGGEYLFIGSVHLSSPGAADFVGEVKMLRLSDGVVIDSERMPNNPRRVAVRSDGRRIFVTDHGTYECHSFDVSAGGLAPAGIADVNTIPGSDANTVGVAVGPSPFPSSVIDPCVVFPGSCHPVDPSDLAPGVMYVGPLRDFGERLIDPLEWNCRRKFPCPGCAQGGYCLWYNFIFDFAGAGLTPEVLTIELIDGLGKTLARDIVYKGTKIVSFQPTGFPEGGKGVELFLVFRLGPKGMPGKIYKLPVRLELTKERIGVDQ
jgi:DNA-binding beta-propeller fold protein YncE